MTRKRHASSAPVKRIKRKEIHILDEDIDYSDIPPSTDEELNRARRVGRPKSENPKQLIAIRISPETIILLRKWAKKEDKPYQTLINEILEKAVHRKKG